MKIITINPYLSYTPRKAHKTFSLIYRPGNVFGDTDILCNGRKFRHVFTLAATYLV